MDKIRSTPYSVEELEDIWSESEEVVRELPKSKGFSPIGAAIATLAIIGIILFTIDIIFKHRSTESSSIFENTK